MLELFFAVCAEGNIPLSPHLRKSAPRGRGKKGVIGEVLKPRVGKSADSGGGGVERMLLEKFPNFNPEWSDELKKKWFDAFIWYMGSVDGSRRCIAQFVKGFFTPLLFFTFQYVFAAILLPLARSQLCK